MITMAMLPVADCYGGKTYKYESNAKYQDNYEEHGVGVWWSHHEFTFARLVVCVISSWTSHYLFCCTIY